MTLLLAMECATSARAVDPVAGPMVGHVTEPSARVWMQWPIAGEVSVTAFDLESKSAVSAVKVGLEGPSPFVCDVPISGLQPNRSYRIEVKFDGQDVRIPAPPLVIRSA